MQHLYNTALAARSASTMRLLSETKLTRDADWTEWRSLSSPLYSLHSKLRILLQIAFACKVSRLHKRTGCGSEYAASTQTTAHASAPPERQSHPRPPSGRRAHPRSSPALPPPATFNTQDVCMQVPRKDSSSNDLFIEEGKVQLAAGVHDLALHHVAPHHRMVHLAIVLAQPRIALRHQLHTDTQSGHVHILSIYSATLMHALRLLSGQAV